MWFSNRNTILFAESGIFELSELCNSMMLCILYQQEFTIKLSVCVFSFVVSLLWLNLFKENIFRSVRVDSSHQKFIYVSLYYIQTRKRVYVCTRFYWLVCISKKRSEMGSRKVRWYNCDVSNAQYMLNALITYI